MRVSDLDIQEIASRLVITVGNYNINKDNIGSYPYVVKGDIVILCDLCIGEKNQEGLYTSSLTVTNELLDKWNISKEMLFSMAVTNGKKIMGPYIEPKGLVAGMEFNHIITNKYHFNGASSIFYDYSLLDNVGDKLLLFPASTNEMYVLNIPDNNNAFISDINELYQKYKESTNAGLTSSVLIYDKSAGHILTDVEGNLFNLDLKNSIEDEYIVSRNAMHSLGK